MPGAPAVTIAGSPVSLGPSATQVAFGAQTIGLEGMRESGLPTLNIGGQLVAVDSASQYIVNGHTVTPDASILTQPTIPITTPIAPQQTLPLQGIVALEAQHIATRSILLAGLYWHLRLWFLAARP